ncbi:MAG: LLM class flavin-dependent oxidoreductase [Chloroflexi bacterium]|nr:LLM class flavin-dependent oxidoreductase [Chloroflexota bacterium]
MSVRIGIALGLWPFQQVDPGPFFDCIDRCEALGVDSVWLVDTRERPAMNVEPVVTMAAIAGRTKRLKVGTAILVLPMRNPVLLAKETAALDFLSHGRTILGIGLGGRHLVEPEVWTAYGVPQASLKDLARRSEEMIALLRRLWTETEVTHHGEFFHVEKFTIYPRPVQQPCIPIWIGGEAPVVLRRVARLGDGWLPSEATPEQVRRGKEAILRHCEEYGRPTSQVQFAAEFSFCFAKSQEEAERAVAATLLHPSPVPLTEVAALGTPDQVRAKVREYVQAGANRLVLRPAGPKGQFMQQVDLLAKEVVPAFAT